MDKATIKQKYIEYLLEEGKKPASVYAFAKTLGLSESEFYNFYASFEAIESEFWIAVFQETLTQLQDDTTYQSYSAREKLLSFYFLWIQKLRNYRSFVLTLKTKMLDSLPLNAPGLNQFRTEFLKFTEGLVNEGIDKKEITYRKYISDKYTYGFWLQALFVLNYWLKDNSANFEMTDAAIEKAVTLSFKLIGDNTFDAAVDFGKFLFHKTA